MNRGDPLRILYLGNNVRGTRCLEEILSQGYNVCGVVAHPVSAALWGKTIADVSRERGLDLFQPRDVNAPEFVDTVKGLHADIGVLAGFSPILKAPILAATQMGMINLHGGSIPEYRGSSITRWVLMNDESVAGISIIQVAEGIDTGDVLAMQRFAVRRTDRSIDIMNKQLERFPGLLINVLRSIEDGTVAKLPQKRNEGSYWHALKPSDGRLNWDRMTARKIYNWVRAFNRPYSGAFCTYEGRQCYIWNVTELDDPFRGIPGRICGVREDGVVVVAQDGGLLVRSIQFPGEPEMSARSVLSVGGQLE